MKKNKMFLVEVVVKVAIIAFIFLVAWYVVFDSNHINTTDIKKWCSGEYIDFRMSGATVIGNDGDSTYIVDDRNIIHIIPYNNIDDNDFLLIWVDNRTDEVIKVWKEIYN